MQSLEKRCLIFAFGGLCCFSVHYTVLPTNLWFLNPLLFHRGSYWHDTKPTAVFDSVSALYVSSTNMNKSLFHSPMWFISFPCVGKPRQAWAQCCGVELLLPQPGLQPAHRDQKHNPIAVSKRKTTFYRAGGWRDISHFFNLCFNLHCTDVIKLGTDYGLNYLYSWYLTCIDKL